MLEALLFQYEDIFGEPFPLADFTEYSEIEVINLLYECVQTNTRYHKGMSIPENRFPEAPRR